MTAVELNDSAFWAEGPTFPARNTKPVDGSERRTHTRTHAANLRNDPLIDPKRFSSFRRLCRVMPWVLRFLKNLTSKFTAKTRGHALLCAEIVLAEKFWTKVVQGEAFLPAESDPHLVQLNS